MRNRMHALAKHVPLSGLCLLIFVLFPLFIACAEGETPLIATFDESVMGVDLTWQFPYSDAMFSHSSEEYDHQLAQVSLGLALSSFRIERVVRPEEERERNAISYLSKAGFTDFESADYDQIPSLQTVSSVLCRKEMTDEQGPYTLVVVGVSGCGYALEWLSNFTVGVSARHEGFSRAAQNVEGRIFVYLAKRGITGRMKLWITGISRAAAISSIVAARVLRDHLSERNRIYETHSGNPQAHDGAVRLLCNSGRFG